MPVVKVAVTLVAAAISFASEAVSVPVTVTVDAPESEAGSVTNALLTSAAVPVIEIPLEIVIVPPVFAVTAAISAASVEEVIS